MTRHIGRMRYGGISLRSMLRFLRLFGLPILGAYILIGSAPRIGAQYYFPRPPVGARAFALASSNLADPRDAHDLNPAIPRDYAQPATDSSSTAERPLAPATLLGT